MNLSLNNRFHIIGRINNLFVIKVNSNNSHIVEYTVYNIENDTSKTYSFNKHCFLKKKNNDIGYEVKDIYNDTHTVYLKDEFVDVLIIEIPSDILHSDDGKDLSVLQVDISKQYKNSGELPENTRVISLKELLNEINEHDPSFYYKTLIV